MAFINAQRWESLEQWRATAFLVAGVIFVVDAALLMYHLSAGTEPAALGQAFVGASWTAAFIGLLGFYPSLIDRSRWLIRAGAIFAVIGGITMAAMATAMLGYASGILSGDPSNVAMFFLPGIFIGIVLGFGLFSIATLRTDIYSRSVGLLFLLLPMTFLFNIGTGVADIGGLPKILGVVSVLALTFLAIGYLLRTDSAVAERERVEAASEVNA